MSTPVYALVLAGGRSARMHTDKAALAYRGRAQLEAAMQLVAPLVARAFVSVRADQAQEPLRARFTQIIDRQESQGPIAGILAAQEEHPHVAWLVIACDLPFLTAAVLEHLLGARDPARDASAYVSTHDGLPEPLCAIYEPASRPKLAAYVALGRHCPRAFLREADVHLIAAADPRALDNINTPAEYAAALSTIQGPTAAIKQLHVQYYALLREEAGVSEEAVATQARTPQELFAELQERHPFSLPAAMLRVSVNEEFGDWSQTLADGDRVVFIPPVAGG